MNFDWRVLNKYIYSLSLVLSSTFCKQGLKRKNCNHSQFQLYTYINFNSQRSHMQEQGYNIYMTVQKLYLQSIDIKNKSI